VTVTLYDNEIAGTRLESTVAEDGKRRTVIRVNCNHRGCKKTIDKPFAGRPPPPEALARHLTQKGWVPCGKKGFTCPTHASPKKEKPVTKKPEEAAPVKAPAEAPAAVVMTRADVRRLRREIDQVFREDLRGYVEGWNDATVAKAIDAPVSWVTKVREDDFGPERAGLSPARREARQKAVREFAEKALERNEALVALEEKVREEITRNTDLARDFTAYIKSLDEEDNA